MMSANKKLLYVFITVLVISSFGTVWGKGTAPKNEKLYYKIQEEIVCLCGCGGLLIKDCFCGNADKVREFLSIQIDSGKSEKEIKAALVKIHGEAVLAEPIFPIGKIIVIIVTLALTFFFVKKVTSWRKNKESSEEGGEKLEASKEEIEYDSRIDKELENMDS